MQSHFPAQPQLFPKRLSPHLESAAQELVLAEPGAARGAGSSPRPENLPPAGHRGALGKGAPCSHPTGEQQRLSPVPGSH